MTTGELRVGVLCEGTHFQAWQAACLDSLVRDGGATLSLLIVKDASDEAGWRKRAQRVYQYRNHLLLYPYWNYLSKPRSIETVDWTSRLQSVPRMVCKVVRKGRFSEYFEESDLAKIREHRLDVLLRMGFGIIRGDILKSARYGVWSFHHGDEERYRGVMPVFWEIHHREKRIGSILQRLTDKLDGGIVLRKKHFDRTGLSLGKNVDLVYFGSAPWPAEVCRDIHRGQADYLNAEPAKNLGPIFPLPSNWDTLKFATQHLLDAVGAVRGER